MYQAALFYEDFAEKNAEGLFDLYPSVSPENTPANILAEYQREVETTKNAAMEFALMKELLTNLLEGCRLTGMYPEKQAKWREMLAKIPPYAINKDGAVREWMDPYYEDHYGHRHHSHLYPIFPGCEVTKEDSLYQAFEKAEDLRLKHGLSDQSSWSVIFMAGIAARMERGSFALTLISTVARTCLMNNFLTVHNDWRRMGPVACADFRTAPFQIDANLGIPAVIHEMLLQSQRDDLFLLPALPDAWVTGHMKGLLARGAIVCDLFWDQGQGYAVLKSDTLKQKRVTVGSGFVLCDPSSQTVDIHGSVQVRFRRAASCQRHE
jgi:alpha-L-fucosidase 2